ncbi:hypothetical protein [Nostoc sp.]|uniref:hypothetical protein n=1 Tax=Nostoc sp. TaxID=1180 RepID=UPI002FFAFA5A
MRLRTPLTVNQKVFSERRCLRWLLTSTKHSRWRTCAERSRSSLLQRSSFAVRCAKQSSLVSMAVPQPLARGATQSFFHSDRSRAR